MTDPSIFQKRLREIREKLGLSQKALGMQIGIDQFSASPRMNQYERGKHFPDQSTLDRLASVVGVPVSYFFAKEDDLAELLVLWAELSSEQRSAVLNMARTMNIGSDRGVEPSGD